MLVVDDADLVDFSVRIGAGKPVNKKTDLSASVTQFVHPLHQVDVVLDQSVDCAVSVLPARGVADKTVKVRRDSRRPSRRIGD